MYLFTYVYSYIIINPNSSFTCRWIGQKLGIVEKDDFEDEISDDEEIGDDDGDKTSSPAKTEKGSLKNFGRDRNDDAATRKRIPSAASKKSQTPTRNGNRTGTPDSLGSKRRTPREPKSPLKLE